MTSNWVKANQQGDRGAIANFRSTSHGIPQVIELLELIPVHHNPRRVILWSRHGCRGAHQSCHGTVLDPQSWFFYHLKPSVLEWQDTLHHFTIFLFILIQTSCKAHSWIRAPWSKPAPSAARSADPLSSMRGCENGMTGWREVFRPRHFFSLFPSIIQSNPSCLA